MTIRAVMRISLLMLAVPLATLMLVSAVSGGSAGGTLTSGRSVMTYSDSIYLSSQLRGGTATIKTSGKTIVVGPAEIVIDGKKVATLSKDAAKIEVHVRKGTVTFLADGQSVPMIQE